MRSSVTTKQGAAFAHLCAACRRQATRSLSTTARNPTTPAPTARRPSPRQTLPPPPATRRFLSQTPRLLEEHSSPSSPAQPATATPSQDPTGSTASSTPRPPSSPPSYYALFPQTLPLGPPPAGPFQIDVRALRREFLRLQAASHPDFHAHDSASPSDRRRAEAVSALINGAFRTLSNPLLRAQYLLREQAGLDLAGDEAGTITGGPAGVDQDLLLEVLEAREVIEEARSEEDLEALKEENEARIRECEEAIGRGFATGDVEALKREVVRLRYWVNIREGIDNWEPGKPVVLEH